MTPEGQLTTLYSFCSQGPFCVDGNSPGAGLVRSTAGSFFGTTVAGDPPTGALSSKSNVMARHHPAQVCGRGLSSSRAAGPRRRWEFLRHNPAGRA
jgi:hypothetical protein